MPFDASATVTDGISFAGSGLSARAGVGARTWTGGAAVAVGVSVALFLAGTRHGIGVLPDTTRYMGMNDVPYDAPLYAWALMLVAGTGLGMAAAAKWIGLVLVIANTALVWHLLARTTARIIPTAIGTALIILSPQFVYQHSLALSEPLFLFFILATCLAFLRYLETERRGWLVGCAVLLGLCALVRFTAPPLGVALAGTLLLSRRHPWARRLADAAVLAVVAGGLFLGWTIASQLSAGHSLGREFALNGTMGAAEWRRSLAVMTAWLLPDQIPFAVRTAVLASVLAAGAWLTVRVSRPALAETERQAIAAPLVPMALGLFFIAYLLFMVLATSIEANLALSGRYAFPPYVAAVLLLTMAWSMSRIAEQAPRIALACLAVIVLGGHVARTAIRTEDAFRSGIGFASRSWTESPAVRRVAALPVGAAVWSNAPDAVTYITGRPAHWLPLHALQRTGKPDPAHPYTAQVEDVRRQLARRPGYLVFFDQVQWRPYYRRSEAELVPALDLRLAAATPDGRIYTAGASLKNIAAASRQDSPAASLREKQP